jgi:hypothetical protein
MLRSATTRVLINGFEGEPFRHGRGLRQGDTLSPLLFVLVMDILAAMFSAAERAVLWGPRITHPEYPICIQFTIP